MSKKKNIKISSDSLVQPAQNLFPEISFRWMAMLIFLFATLLYFNTFFNQYALDDGIVITDNHFTMKGFSGIADIFSHDTFASIEGVSGELSGGRYRPLSVATFAVEVGLFGKNPFISHLINVLIYSSICVLLLFLLFKYFFPKNGTPALLSVLFFTVHPTHTEVVANIKSRDELLAFFFVLISVITYFEYLKSKKIWLVVISLLTYFISLFSKESGIPFLAAIPLMVYFFTDRNFAKSLATGIPFFIILVGYFLIRYKIVGLSSSTTSEVMNSPFVLASGEEAFATKVMILGKYLMLLFIPHPLSFDYSYPQIPYVSMRSWSFLLSLLVNGFLVFYAIKNFSKKHILSFSILFYFITFSIVSNFVFDVGAPMGDRFLFQPSLGFSIAAAWLLISFISKSRKENFQFRKKIVTAFLALIFLLFSVKTISRNFDWKNNDSLFIADSENAPNSAKTNGHCAVTYIKLAQEEKDETKKKEYFFLAEKKARKAAKLYPSYADAYINLGNIYLQTGQLEDAKEAMIAARNIYPGNSVLKTNLELLSAKFGELAIKNFNEKKLAEAIRNNTSAVECNPSNSMAWYNLGGYYLTQGNIAKAKEAWTKAHQLSPENAEIKSWLDKISN